MSSFYRPRGAYYSSEHMTIYIKNDHIASNHC